MTQPEFTLSTPKIVIPAQAGILRRDRGIFNKIPACAGMTHLRVGVTV